jgi:dihydrodipicolinate reductase
VYKDDSDAGRSSNRPGSFRCNGSVFILTTEGGKRIAMVKAIVTGVSSKMGGRLVQFVYEADGIELIGAVDSKGSSAIGQDVGEYHHKGLFGVLIAEDLRDCIKHSCVVIDFTDKESSLEHLKIAAEHKTSMVIGTMGFMLDEMERIRELTKKTRCVLVPNVSPVLFSEMGAGVELIYRSFIRDTFAREAIAAAKWIVKQKNGLYDMQDVLGLK